MKSKLRLHFICLIVSLFFLSGISISQVKILKKAPKFVLTIGINYDYAMSRAYGSVTDFSALYDSTLGGEYFNGQSLGMQHGGGLMVIGKLAVGKKRRARFNVNAGYNLFYNTSNVSNTKTMWHIFNGSLGFEYNFAPKSRFQPYIGGELLYTLMFGRWQTDITYSGNISNVSIKFKPSSRFGAALNAGMEYRVNKRTGLLLGYRVVWANIAPKQNKLNADAYNAYINDSQLNNNINIGFTRQIVYLQIIGGVSIYLKR